MTANQIADIKRQAFSNAFFNALMEAMTEASGSSWSFSPAAEGESIAEGSELVWTKLTLDGSLQGEFLLELERAAASMLVSKIVRLPADEFGEEHSAALLKLIKSGTDRFRFALKQEFGSFTVKAAVASDAASDRAYVSQIAASDDAGNRAAIRMYLGSSLAEALAPPPSKAGNPAVASVKQPKSAAAKAIADQLNLNLVMDVELNVTLRFGQRQLTLREVLDLTTGSVVELDRQVDEPVELLLDGVVIAKGEAVVVDGNYGLRVTEVLQPVSATMLK
jgi:flagellar motor switch protein FliN/FliY